ncbi:hypothetical protein C487_08082 [Natrinema pallidum DSM 3751]|uniref:Uncharacterized protein n=1 Tax=Natrinema pallidum DSM 3751 TaxID=1227495 RepID=L9Z095_9EURY|nr:hypothetical protein C487_08082 [Natrinema pallidum DSM 3751]
MKRLEKYLRWLYRVKMEQRIYRCSNCGCTYETNEMTCQECWGGRLVRIK